MNGWLNSRMPLCSRKMGLLKQKAYPPLVRYKSMYSWRYTE